MQEPFNGFDSIKQQFPSATFFSIPVLYRDSLFHETRQLVGQVNADPFEGRKPTTVYFVGMNGSSANRLAKLMFVHRPEGWNTLFREESKSWEEARYETGRPLYFSADFHSLAALKIPDGAPILKFGSPDPDAVPDDDGDSDADLSQVKVVVDLQRYETDYSPPTLVAKITNVGTIRASQMSVWWVYENEVPQPGQAGLVPYHEVAGSLQLTQERSFGGTLGPGDSREFCLPPSTVLLLRSQTAALSPERYWLAVKCGEQEVTRVAGRIVGEFIDRLENLGEGEADDDIANG